MVSQVWNSWFWKNNWSAAGVKSVKRAASGRAVLGLEIKLFKRASLGEKLNESSRAK